MIAQRYAARGTRVRPEEVLVLNGSQQGLDLIAKVLVDQGEQHEEADEHINQKCRPGPQQASAPA